MKIRIPILVALALSFVFVSLTNSVPKAQAVSTYIVDTGMITLATNQSLRLTAANSAPRARPTSLTITFTAQVTTSTCTNGVCTHTVTSQTSTDPVTLAPGQAASYDISLPAGASAVRATVLGDGPDYLVNALIIDNTTGQGLLFVPLPAPVRLL